MRVVLGLMLASVTVAAFGARWVWSCGRPPGEVAALCVAAVSDDKDDAGRAIKGLRELGPAGLAALMRTYDAAIQRHRANPAAPDAGWDRLAAALDGVAAQKDAWAAGLYWYTDLDAAKRAAKAAGKPILSLRLLGTLDTEFSCANSRFFRTVLYPNADVAKALREGFVLHWQSHRPVPRLTIDFGDGRKIERTITGNSVHYVLTPDGRVVDVIPGLYGPAAFLRQLTDGRDLAMRSGDAGFEDELRAYHATRLVTLRRAWAEDLRRIGSTTSVRTAPAGDGARPTAMAGTRVAVAKARAETPAVAAAMTVADRATLAAGTDDAAWAKIALLHAADGRLDEASRAVMRSKLAADAANRLTMSKMIVEDPLNRVVRNFERSVAEDTVRNEYLLHGRVHEWFATGAVPARLDDLNERVYAQLFLMPRSDPWLGLVPADTYTGLPADRQ